MKEYQLNVDPRILELLGPNLYTNIYYVLAELIANAYDADAKNVYIIANSDDIRVEDDGHGMSYEAGEIDKYLNVAGPSRESEEESMSKSKTRHKMGRKGVGKLAALSVSENVDILTISNGEKSGFILSRRPEEGNKLKPIDEDTIQFQYVEDHGSAIVMRNPQYRLHKTLYVIQRNLLKIFPLVDANFRIHIIRGREQLIVEEFDKTIMTELSSLITLGSQFSSLCELVPNVYPQRQSDLVVSKESRIIPITMKNNQGKEREYSLQIDGWIGSYKTTRGRKVEMTDFPDNFISLFANKKMGEFNILPVVGQNKLNEVYVVGQLHIDLFELTELPDMALSNRQGYKSDDPRYITVLDYIRNELLSDILKKREIFSDLSKSKKKEKREEELRKNEEKLKQSMDAFRKKASENAAGKISQLGNNFSMATVEEVISQSINDNSPDIGLKTVIDSQKKKILISQTFPDKPFADVVYQMLIYNNIPADDILYTNCDNEVCRVPEGRGVYEYLKEFFVESYSTKKIFAIFVTSANTKESWGAITEVGAAWITQVDHKIFNIHPFRPEHPLNDEMQWQTTNRDDPKTGNLWMNSLSADIFCQKIESICDILRYRKKTRTENTNYLGSLIEIKNESTIIQA